MKKKSLFKKKTSNGVNIKYKKFNKYLINFRIKQFLRIYFNELLKLFLLISVFFLFLIIPVMLLNIPSGAIKTVACLFAILCIARFIYIIYSIKKMASLNLSSINSEIEKSFPSIEDRLVNTFSLWKDRLRYKNTIAEQVVNKLLSETLTILRKLPAGILPLKVFYRHLILVCTVVLFLMTLFYIRPPVFVNAFSTISKSPAAPYSNPAGLSGVDDFELSLIYAPLWMDSRYAVVNYAHPLPPVIGIIKDTTIGLSYYLLESGWAESTSILRETAGPSFRDKWDIFYITYARKISPYRNFGLNYKIINRSFAGYDTSLSGFDIAFQGKVLFNRGRNIMKWGINIQNLMLKQLKLRNAEKIPPNIKLGLSYALFNDRLKALLDIDQVLGDKPLLPRWYFGSEITVHSLFKIRAGINYKQMSAGFGINLFNLALDYAFVFHELGALHRVGLNFRFGKKFDSEEEFIKREKEKVKTKLHMLDRARESYKQLIDKAMEIFLDGDYEKAKEELRKVAYINPASYGLVEDALEKIDEVIQRKKTEEIDAYYNEAVKYFENNRFEATSEKIKKVLEIYPGHLKALMLNYWNEGFIYIKKGKLKEGEESLKKALSIDPENKKLAGQLKKLRKYRDTIVTKEE